MINRIVKSLSLYLFPPLEVADVILCSGISGESFSLSIEKSFRSGFYMLECRFQTKVAAEVLQFSSFHGEQQILASLPLQTGRLNKRIVYCPTVVDGWRLSMLDDEMQPVRFEKEDCEYLRFVPLRKSFAVKCMLKRMQGSEVVSNGREQKSYEHFIGELYRLYDRSFLFLEDERYQRWIDWAEIKEVSCSHESGGVLQEFDCYHYSAPNYKLEQDVWQRLELLLSVNPQGVIAYCDEDSIDAAGLRKNPWFKPDWNPDFFLTRDYISNCYVCRRDWYLEHELVFKRLGERLALSFLLPDLPDGAILHLPQVLAHRVDAAADETESVDWQQQRNQLLDSILPDGVEVGVGLLAGSARLRYHLADPAPVVSLLVPTRNGLNVLKPCVESILAKTVYPDYEILILDNQSDEESTLTWLDSIAQDARVRVLKYDKPFNYSSINDFGVRHSCGSVIGLINNDVEVISPDWLVEMVSNAMRPEIGCVGAKLYYSNGQIQHGGVILGLGDVAGHAHRFFAGDSDGYHGRLKLVQNYSAVTAACLLVRREIYDEVGGLEEEHLAVAYNDVDFCLRVREAGYRNLWTPYAELYHHESVSRGEDDTPVKQARYQKEVAYMQKTWSEQLANDPCYNPNLCRRREDFSLPDVLF